MNRTKVSKQARLMSLAINVGLLLCCYGISVYLHYSVSSLPLMPFGQRHVYSISWSRDQFCAWLNIIKGLCGLDAKIA